MAAATESEVTTCRIMSPDDANPAGNVHGGTIMRMIESAGYVAAMRHLHSQKDSSGSKPSCRAAVTHRLEHMDFLKPIYIGNLAKLQARVIFVKNASLLVEVIVKAEDLTKVSESLCNKAYVWYLSMEKAEEGEDEEKTVLLFP
uniref:HotDog ACOT-type domain-containing protein n=1 Tax=Bigelowiella natans TaxID=227086 RepID=A0A7S2KMU9_BIGNA